MDGSLLESVFIFLLAACLLVPISKLSGLGSVIGYLIAGILIGPFALGFISEPETILHFSEFGVVMMLFIIGLELKPSALWDMRVKLVGLGGLQVALTTVFIAAAAYLLGMPLAESLVIGMALALSSTAIAVQTMQDRGMMGTSAGQAGFSVLLFQDVIVIAMIASLPLVASFGGIDHSVTDIPHDGGHGPKAHSGPEGIWRAAAIFGVFGGMVLAGRLLLRPLFRLIAKSKVRETFTAMALLLVVGAALLMHWLGLSAALGAFIAGVVLADSEYRHQLERDIEPFKALLLGLFFMSVGMSLNLVTLAQNPLGIAGMVIGLIALKFAILFAIGHVFKLEKASNLLFASLLAQAGEFGFVLFQFALVEQVIKSDTVTVLSAVIALSMALTPLIVLIYDKFIAPRFNPAPKTGDAPKDKQNRVIVLGFGRVGQLAARLLHMRDIDTTIIDHDGDHIEFIKQFGYKVYYGDGSDVDLLSMAGAAKADIIIIAIDNVDKAVQAARDIKEHFPNAKIIARARNRPHLFELMAVGVDFIERETFRASLAMGRQALEYLGHTKDGAQALSDKLAAHDWALVEETYMIRDDMNALAAKAETARQMLKNTLDADQEAAEKGMSN